jgi:hypothetical protein
MYELLQGSYVKYLHFREKIIPGVARGRYIPNHFLVTVNSHECPNKVTWGRSMEKPMVHIALRINAHGKITEYWIGWSLWMFTVWGKC